MADPITMARIGLLLGDGQNRKRLGWVVATILSPIILVVALLCVLGSGAVDHNISAAQLCFGSGEIPAETPAEYRACIEQTRTSFAELDTVMADIQSKPRRIFLPARPQHIPSVRPEVQPHEGVVLQCGGTPRGPL